MPLSEIRPYFSEELHRFPRFLLREYLQYIGSFIRELSRNFTSCKSKINAMDIETFEWGSWQKGNGYKYYLPNKINHPWKWDHSDINTLLEEASMKLGELNSFARLVPNIDLFIQLHVTTEAVVSSRIEGTQTNIDEALLPEEGVAPERREDWNEVRNYTEALKDLPISSRLIRQTHKTLLSGVRGEHKLPGEYRTSQNWIGGATIKDAVFIPPRPSAC